MKCIHCGTEAPRSDAEACPGCHRRFAFKPSIYRDDSDEWFKNAIDGVSGDGTVRFTTRQLWYEVNRRWTDPPFHPGRYPFLLYAAGGAFPGMAASAFLPGPAAYTLAGAGALAGAYEGMVAAGPYVVGGTRGEAGIIGVDGLG